MTSFPVWEGQAPNSIRGPSFVTTAHSVVAGRNARFHRRTDTVLVAICETNPRCMQSPGDRQRPAKVRK